MKTSWMSAATFITASTLFACSTSDLILSGMQFGATAVSSIWKGARLKNETDLFVEHWELLNTDALYDPTEMPKKDKDRIEKDLQKILDDIVEEYPQLLKENPQLKSWSGKLPKPKVEIELSKRVHAYTRQDASTPVVVISSALLSTNLEQFSSLMETQIAAYRRTHSSSDEDELFIGLMEEIKIPRALEYKDALRFVLAHESVHVLLDPPMKEGDATAEIEATADALGLVLTGRCSPIVSIKQSTLGMENLMIIYNGNTGDKMYRAVGYARFGPEMLFNLHRHAFEPNSKGIYKTVDERIAASKAYMNQTVSNNIHTGYDTLLLYLLNSVGRR